MKIAVIDVGSNSVRLLLWLDGKTLYKRITTTRLAEGARSGVLQPDAMVRTAQAIANYVSFAKNEKVDCVYAFATEAVRSAKNAEEFCLCVHSLCGVNLDILTGELEAEIGALGVLGGKDGAVIDVGGASAEVLLYQNGKVTFAKSLPLGAVRLHDLAGKNFDKILQTIQKSMAEISYPIVGTLPVYAIGGTATTLASVLHELKDYDPAITHGTKIVDKQLLEFAQRFCVMPTEEVSNVVGMDKKRADVIGGGALLLYLLVKAIRASNIIVSEFDNLEGYLQYKL